MKILMTNLLAKTLTKRANYSMKQFHPMEIDRSAETGKHQNFVSPDRDRRLQMNSIGKSCRVAPFLITSILLALLSSCSGGNSDPEPGPIGPCTVDPSAGTAESGHYDGRFAFSESDVATYPLEMDVDVDTWEISGSLSFEDNSQSYEGTLDGSLDSDGQVSGNMQFRGTDGDRSIEGSFEGVFGAAGGCGTWENEAGQGGPWEVGDLGGLSDCNLDDTVVFDENDLLGVWLRADTGKEHKGKEYLDGGKGYLGNFSYSNFERESEFSWSKQGGVLTEKRDSNTVYHEHVLLLEDGVMRQQRQEDCKERTWNK